MDLGRLIPGFWSQQRDTDDAWDRALNRALDEQGVLSVGAHEATVGPFTVWVSNWPYSFGYDRANPLEPLPRVRTRIRLKRAIAAFKAAQYERQFDGS